MSSSSNLYFKKVRESNDHLPSLKDPFGRVVMPSECQGVFEHRCLGLVDRKECASSASSQCQFCIARWSHPDRVQDQDVDGVTVITSNDILKKTIDSGTLCVHFVCICSSAPFPPLCVCVCVCVSCVVYVMCMCMYICMCVCMHVEA